MTRQFLRVTISLILAALAVVTAAYLLPTRPTPAQAQFSTQTPVYRYLDTAGNGTGYKNAISSTYATTATAFYLQPPAAAVYNISRLIVSVEDDAVITPTLYGAATITNGVIIRRVSGSTVITLTDGVTLSTNLAWRRLCEVEQTNLAGVTNQLQAVCDFAVPIRLNGDKSERLEVLLQDDMSGLEGQYFMAQGWKE